MRRYWKSMLAGIMLAVLFGMPGLIKCSYAETDVTDKVEVIQSRLMFDRSTSQSYLNVSVKNISGDVLLTPIKVVVDSISSTDVTVANADGTTDDGKPYFKYTATTGQLLTGEATESKTWYFDNPNRARFTYTLKIVGSEFISTLEPASESKQSEYDLGGEETIPIITKKYSCKIELPQNSNITLINLIVESGVDSDELIP